MEKIAQEVQQDPNQYYAPGLKHKVHFRVDEDLHRRLRSYTAQMGITVQQFIEQLVRNALPQ